MRAPTIPAVRASRRAKSFSCLACSRWSESWSRVEGVKEHFPDWVSGDTTAVDLDVAPKAGARECPHHHSRDARRYQRALQYR